jgi:glycosyltransferase involved in cell wall biosynthesis
MTSTPAGIAGVPDAAPLVSVIVPVFNGERFLRDAVASIRDQRHEPLEIIVVDDGSTDATRTVVASLAGEIRYIHQPNAGPPAARNTGLRAARGALVAFLDADDLWTDGKLAIQTGLLAREPAIDVVLGYTEIVYLPAVPGGAVPPPSPPAFLFSLGAALIRRSVFDRVGGFDETSRYCDDVDWFLRAKEAGLSVQVHQDVVQRYRRHDANLTNQRALDWHFFISTLKKSLDRRRGAAGGSPRDLGPWLAEPETPR